MDFATGKRGEAERGREASNAWSTAASRRSFSRETWPCEEDADCWTTRMICTGSRARAYETKGVQNVIPARSFLLGCKPHTDISNYSARASGQRLGLFLRLTSTPIFTPPLKQRPRA